MARRIGLAALLAALTCLLFTSSASAFWRRSFYRGGYGGYGRDFSYRNPYTGGYSNRGSAYNPYTGRYHTEGSYYNPYTGRYGHAGATYNPYTGRYAYHYGSW